jgi:hypothetical protein
MPVEASETKKIAIFFTERIKQNSNVRCCELAREIQYDYE